jgi:nitrate/nitrite transporter NarK
MDAHAQGGSVPPGETVTPRTPDVASPTRAQAYVFGFGSLLLVSFTAAASYVSYDVISPIGDILEKDLQLSSTEVNLLYSVYSIPVILFVVLGGLLADRLGVRKAGILFTLVFVFGSVLTAVPIYPVMLLGRLFFGIGAEAFYVVMNKIVAKWFKDKTLAMAFGINLFLCRAGTYFAFFALPWLVEKLNSWQLTLWVVGGICAVSIPAMTLYALADRYGDAHGMTGLVESDEKFSLKDVFRLPAAFWVISLLCMVYYSAIFPFTAVAPRVFRELYDLDRDAASKLTGVLILISMFTTWFFGLIVDRYGKRTTIMILGSLLMIPCHASMAFTNIDPWIPMVALGISFSLVPAALWPALPLMVKDQQLGTAFGVIGMVQNVGLFLFPLAAGALRDSTGNYRATMTMFSGLAVLGLLLAIWLKVIETRSGGYLDKRATA